MITTAQLLKAGLSRDAINTAVATGRLYTMRETVYRTAGALPSIEQAWMAAALAAGCGYLLSDETGALIHRLDPAPSADAIHLLTTADLRVRMPGVRSHRTNVLPDRDRVLVRGLPVTSVARTLADISSRVSPDKLGLAADDAIRRGILNARELWRVAATLPPTGRRSYANFRAILPERVPGYQPGDSYPELRVRNLIEAAGLEVPVPLFKVKVGRRTYELDLAWPLAMHALEWDSYEFHGQVESFHDDRAKRRALRRAGWTIDELTCRTHDSEILEIAAIATEATRRARAELPPSTARSRR